MVDTVRIDSLTAIWNNAATTFSAIKMNVTDTASAAASLLMDLRVGGVSKLKVTKNGGIRGSIPYSRTDVLIGPSDNSGFSWSSGVPYLSVAGASIFAFHNLGLGIDGTAYLGWMAGQADAGAADLTLYRDAANTLAQRNGVNAQIFNIYNTYDGTNNEWMRIGYDAVNGEFQISNRFSGTGAARPLVLRTMGAGDIILAPAATRSVVVYAPTLFGSDNAHDIGASGATRPRTIYPGTGIGGLSRAAAPTATELPAGQFIVQKITGGAVSLYYNDAGTIKSVALA